MNELLTTLERASVQGGIALAVVWVLCRLLSRLPARFRCWLWRLAFLKCLVGLFLAFTVAVPILPAAPPVAPFTASVLDAASAPNVSPATPDWKPEPDLPAVPVEEIPVVAESPWNSPSSWLMLCYALGVAAGVVRLMVGGIRTYRLVHRAETVTHPALPELAARFGRRTAPRLARSAEVTSPLLAFSTILLPLQPTDDEPLILGHELAHLQRRDLAWEWLGTVTQILFWFHPLVWLARREERMTREQAADALAIAVTAVPPADYARALVAASLRRNGRIPTLSVGAVERGSRLRQRLEALTQPGLPRRQTMFVSGIALALTVVAFIPWKAVARQQPAPPANESTPPPASETTLDSGNSDRIRERELAPARQKDAPRQTASIMFMIRLPDGKPASKTIVLVHPHPYSTRRGWGTNTDARGRCQISGLEPGEYEVRCIRLARDFISSDKTILEIPRDRAIVRKELTLLPAAQIIGRVTDAGGNPIPEVDMESGWSQAKTGPKGAYTLLVPVGSVVITAGGSAPKTVLSRADKPTTVDFSLTPEALGIPIRVWNSQRKPVRARVDIRWGSGSGSYLTDEEGKLYWKPGNKPQVAAKVYAFAGNEGAVATIPPGPYKPLDLELSEQNVGQVTFRVTDAAQKPIPNLLIEIAEGASSHADRFRPLDGEGRYRLPIRPDMPVQLRAYADGYQPQNLSARPGVKKIEVRAGESKYLGHTILPPATETARGEIRDAQNKPLAKREFRLILKSGDRTGRTDAHGRFTIPGVTRGESCTLLVQPAGPPRKTWMRRGLVVGDMGIITPVQNRPATQSTPPEKQPPASKPAPVPRDELTGTVTNSLGQPVPHAKVSWVVGGPPTPKVIAETTSNERGEFSFTDSNATTMSLRSYWHLPSRTWLMVRADGFGLGVRQLRHGTVHVKFELMPPRTYSVAFRDTQGRPIVGLPVWADSLQNEFSGFRLRWLGYESKTDARGEFHASGLPPHYSVYFGFDRTKWTVVNKDLDIDQVPIPKDGKRIYILDTGHTVVGTIRYPDGQPARGVVVGANPVPATPGRTGASTQTDSQGRYRLVGLGDGEHRLRVHLIRKIPNLVAPNTMPLSIPKQQARLRKDLLLQPAAKVVGWVTDKKGKPLSGLTVTNGTAFGVSAGNGYYEVNVPAGEASLGIRGKYKQTIHTRADRPTRLDFAIERDRVTEVEGEVVDEYNRPIPGANVHIIGERTSGRTVTNSEGKFSWGNVIGKQAFLSVYAECGTAGASAKVTPQDTGPVRLKLSEKAVGHLTGKVTDAEGRAISGLKILVMANGSGTGYNPPTDDQGRFKIAVRPDAVYSLRFNAPGYGERGLPDYFQSFRSKSLKEQKWVGKLSGVQPGESKDLGHIVMVKGRDSATGQIRDPENRPVAHLQVQLVTPSGQWLGKTNAAGEFTIPGVVQGERAVLIIYNVRGDYRRNWIRRDLTVGAMGVISLTTADIIQAPP